MEDLKTRKDKLEVNQYKTTPGKSDTNALRLSSLSAGGTAIESMKIGRQLHIENYVPQSSAYTYETPHTSEKQVATQQHQPICTRRSSDADKINGMVTSAAPFFQPSIPDAENCRARYQYSDASHAGESSRPLMNDWSPYSTYLTPVKAETTNRRMRTTSSSSLSSAPPSAARVEDQPYSPTLEQLQPQYRQSEQSRADTSMAYEDRIYSEDLYTYYGDYYNNNSTNIRSCNVRPCSLAMTSYASHLMSPFNTHSPFGPPTAATVPDAGYGGNSLCNSYIASHVETIPHAQFLSNNAPWSQPPLYGSRC